MNKTGGGLRRKRLLQREDIPLYIMSFPAVISLIIFSYLPMGGLVMAFQNFNVTKGFAGSDFVGLKNFEFLFSSSDAFIITRNTVLYNLAFIAVNLFLSVAVALILSEIRSKRSAKVFQTIYMMPFFLSWAVVV